MSLSLFELLSHDGIPRNHQCDRVLSVFLFSCTIRSMDKCHLTHHQSLFIFDSSSSLQINRRYRYLPRYILLLSVHSHTSFLHNDLCTISNNQIRGYSRPIIYWGVYDIPVLTIWAHSLSFLISCSRMFAYNNNFLSPSLWYTRLFIVSIIKG